MTSDHRVEDLAAERDEGHFDAVFVEVGAHRKYPGLTYDVSVGDAGVTVRLHAPLDLPLTIPGSPERASIGAVGSATVATITAVGIMPGVVANSGVSPELVVLAIGAGSVFFSHVNDPGFWLVKSYVGTSTADTFRTWSLLETAISVVGLVLVLALSYVV